MARIRTIKPELPRDATLARVARPPRYTFLLLITQADDEGFFPANPRTLLGMIYPHDTDITERILCEELDQLREVGRLKVFDTPDGPVGLIVNFKKHQKIDHPSKSYLASLSRKSRATFAPVVLSLDLGPVPVPVAEKEESARAPDGAPTLAIVNGTPAVSKTPLLDAIAPAMPGVREAREHQLRRNLLPTVCDPSPDPAPPKGEGTAWLPAAESA